MDLIDNQKVENKENAGEAMRTNNFRRFQLQRSGYLIKSN